MPTVIDLDIDNIPLAEFMQSIGCKPVTTAGGLIAYNPPYNGSNAPTFVVNTNTNRWIDTANGKKGGIYDLAYELTGTYNISDLNMYIATQMSSIREVKIRHEPDYAPGYNSMLSSRVQPKQEQPKPKPKRRFRF